MHPAPPAAVNLSALRRHIAALERRSPTRQLRPAVTGREPRPWRIGLDALDAALPTAGLSPCGIHEAAGATAADRPAAMAFLVALLVRSGRRGLVPVCQGPGGITQSGRLYGPGWHALGADPAALLIVETRCERDSLWAMEECLRSGTAAAVLGETERLSFVASRRLALAARESGTPLLLLRGSGLDDASAAFSRWRVSTLSPEYPDLVARTPFDIGAPGPSRWRVEMLRCRGGRPTTGDMEWNRETGDFGMVAALADRPAAPHTGWRAAS